MDEESHYILLMASLDGMVCHVASAYKERPGHQAMTALKRWFSGNDAQQNTIDSIIDDLRALKLDESMTACECINEFMELMESSSALGEKCHIKLLEIYSYIT